MIKKSKSSGAWLAIGIGVGVSVGVAIKNIGAGIALGVAFGLVMKRLNDKKTEQSDKHNKINDGL